MPIIIAVILALSVVGGGVVYAAETAPPSSPLHPIQVAVNDTVDQVTTVTTSATGGTTDSTGDMTTTITSTLTLDPRSSDGSRSRQMDDSNNNGNRDDHHAPITGTLPVTITFPVSDTDGITITFPIHERRGITGTNPFTGSLGITFTNILTNVEGLGNVGTGHEDNGLLAKLRAAADAIARGQSAVATRILNAFAHELNALNQSGRLSSDSYTTLTNDYASLISQLGGTPVPTVVSTVTPSVTATPDDPSTDKHSGKDKKNEGHQRAERTPWPTDTTTAVPSGTVTASATPNPTATGGSPNDDPTRVSGQPGASHDRGQGQLVHPIVATNPSPTGNQSTPPNSGNDSPAKTVKHGDSKPTNSSDQHSSQSGADHPASAAPSNNHQGSHGSNHGRD